MRIEENFIVVHNSNNEVGIIFKNKIEGMVKHDDGTADILLESGYIFYAIDKYEDIIKCLI